MQDTGTGCALKVQLVLKLSALCFSSLQNHFTHTIPMTQTGQDEDKENPFLHKHFTTKWLASLSHKLQPQVSLNEIPWMEVKWQELSLPFPGKLGEGGTGVPTPLNLG
jgi:hypothetical protein